MSYGRAVLILAVFVLATLAAMPVQAVLLLVAPDAARRFGWRYWWFLARLTDTRIIPSGEQVKGGVLIAANHSSWLDIIVLGAIRPASFIAKREVESWPFFGLIAKLGRTIFVDRDSRRAVLAPQAEMRERLAAGDTLILFPEGTSSDGNRVLRFRSALLSAADTDSSGRPVTVQPVTIAYLNLWGIPLDRRRRPQFAWYGDMPLMPHLWQALCLGPVDVAVIFHPAMTIGQAGGRKALAAYCEQSIRDALPRR